MSLLSTHLQEITMDNEMPHAENALKLTQILDLEQLLYDLRILDEEDGSPCWCACPASSDGLENHSFSCVKAREATEPFWKGIELSNG